MYPDFYTQVLPPYMKYSMMSNTVLLVLSCLELKPTTSLDIRPEGTDRDLRLILRAKHSVLHLCRAI